jgi:hypothetical protein
MSSIICRCCTSRQTKPPSPESAPVQITWSRTIPVSCCSVGTSARFVIWHDFQNVWGPVRGRQVMRIGGEVIFSWIWKTSYENWRRSDLLLNLKDKLWELEEKWSWVEFERQVMRIGGEVILWVEFDCSVWFQYVANCSTTTVTTNHVYSERHWTKQFPVSKQTGLVKAVLPWWYTPWVLLRLRFCVKLLIVSVPYVWILFLNIQLRSYRYW